MAGDRIRSGQWVTIRTLLRQVHITTAGAARAFLSDVVGRPIWMAAALTADEASRVIDSLREWAADEPAPDDDATADGGGDPWAAGERP